MKAQRTLVPSDRKDLMAILAVAAMAVMMFSASARAEVVSPHVVTPHVVTPTPVDPPPPPPKLESSPAPTSPPPVVSGSEPHQTAASQNPPSHRRGTTTRGAPRSGPDPRLVEAAVNWENMSTQDKGAFLASLSDEQTVDFSHLFSPTSSSTSSPTSSSTDTSVPGGPGPVVEEPPGTPKEDFGKTWLDRLGEAVGGCIRQWEQWFREQ